MVQLSFTLPIPHRQAGRGRRAAARRRRWASTRRWWCTPSRWATASRSSSSTARVNHLVDLSKVQVVERDFPLLGAKEINTLVKQRLRRKLVVVGACIGTDAHTVGIDAILNVKGIAGEKGLEYYRELRGGQHGRAGQRTGAGRDGPGTRRPTRSWSARSSPSATRTCTTRGRCRPRSGRRCRPTGGRCSSSAAPASTR